MDHYARRYDRAIEQYHKAVELAPGLRTLNNWLKMSYEQKELYDQAIEVFVLTTGSISEERIAATHGAVPPSGRF